MAADGCCFLLMLEGIEKFLLQLDHFFGKVQHLIAFFGQGNAFDCAVEKLGIQLLLKVFESGAQSLACDMQIFAGNGQ